MTPINPNYYALGLQTPAFRANEKNKITTVTTNPVPQPNVSFKGTEALAAYNYNLVNKNNDFDIPIIKPITIPDNIEDVKGERIYNSVGDLMEIVDEDKNFKYVYKKGRFPEIKYEFFIINKKTDKIVKSQTEYNYDDHTTIYVQEIINPNLTYYTHYDKKTLKPLILEKIINDDNKSKSILYNIEHDCYNVSLEDKNKRITKWEEYDKDKVLIDETISKINIDRFKELDKPQLHQAFELNYNPKDLNGDKKYYSNGEIEQITVNENGSKTKYNFYANGKLKNIEKGNLTIHYFNDYCEQKEPSGYSIQENLGNGKFKTSGFYTDGTSFCCLEENGKGKQYYFDKKGEITDYHEYKNDIYWQNHDALMRKDYNNDGKVTVEEFFHQDYIKNMHPELYEKDKIALIKYANQDGNENINTEEFSQWLNSNEHEEVLDDLDLLRAEKIKQKRK